MRRFEDMHPVFEEYGVRVVALSADSTQKAHYHARRDGLEHIELLADPQLNAISGLGLVHPRGYPFRTVYLFGIPIGYPQLPRRMGLPTSILLDEQGVVRWIDQADDYRMRGDRARIEGALAGTFSARAA